ncbi:hypothetical protein GGR56DRAFT_154422 [Xylariaceae sp. FL0804]|nr:hypothetical protein GGR56DRAFT_154422 [Xylariaceae sp. FL0804]
MADDFSRDSPSTFHVPAHSCSSSSSLPSGPSSSSFSSSSSFLARPTQLSAGGGQEQDEHIQNQPQKQQHPGLGSMIDGLLPSAMAPTTSLLRVTLDVPSAAAARRLDPSLPLPLAHLYSGLAPDASPADAAPGYLRVVADVWEAAMRRRRGIAPNGAAGWSAEGGGCSRGTSWGEEEGEEEGEGRAVAGGWSHDVEIEKGREDWESGGSACEGDLDLGHAEADDAMANSASSASPAEPPTHTSDSVVPSTLLRDDWSYNPWAAAGTDGDGSGDDESGMALDLERDVSEEGAAVEIDDELFAAAILAQLHQGTGSIPGGCNDDEEEEKQ